MSSNWREEILEYATIHTLPIKWNDEKHEDFKAELATPIPFTESEYLCNRVSKHPLEFEKIKVTAGKTLLITKDLKQGDILSWWVSGDADFGIGVYFSKNKDEKNPEK